MSRIDPPEDAAEGAHLLRRFLDEQGLSIPKFAEQHQLPRLVLQKLMNGETRRVSVDIAFAIQKATDKFVPAETWCQAGSEAA